jgi:hypothetical protein
MSVVYDVAIVFYGGGDEVMRQVNAWMIEKEYGPFVRVSDNGGGYKAHQWDMWSGAFNYLQLDTFLEMLADVPMERWGWAGKYGRDGSLVVIRTEHEDKVQSVRIGQPYPWETSL